MERKLFYSVLLVTIASAKDEDLPLCPTNFQFFPQSLPMHCRMPTAADFQQGFPNMMGLPTPQTPADTQKAPPPPPVPGMPPPLLPMPPIPGAIGLPSPMIPMPGATPNHKVPVIVMPFYSPDTSFKNLVKSKKHAVGHTYNRPRRPHKSIESSSDTDSDTSTDTDTDTDTDTSSSAEGGFWKGKKQSWRRNAGRANKRHQQHHSHRHHSKRRHNKKKQTDLLTPVLQYVSKDGYVIYEKTISKGEAKDWLKVNKEEPNPEERVQYKNTAELEKKIVETKSGEQDYAEELSAKEERERTKTTPPHPRRFHREENDAVIKKIQT